MQAWEHCACARQGAARQSSANSNAVGGDKPCDAKSRGRSCLNSPTIGTVAAKHANQQHTAPTSDGQNGRERKEVVHAYRRDAMCRDRRNKRHAGRQEEDGQHVWAGDGTRVWMKEE